MFKCLVTLEVLKLISYMIGHCQELCLIIKKDFSAGEKVSMQMQGREIVSLKLQGSVLEMLALKWGENYLILEKRGH